MYHLPSDTVAGIKAGPLFTKRSRAGVLVPRVAAQLKKYHTAASEVYVEREGIAFYLLNHLFWIVSRKRAALEILAPVELKMAQSYSLIGSMIAKRLFYYTLLITTREARHMGKSATVYATLKSKYGPEFVEFHKFIQSSGSGGVVGKLQDKPPMMTLGDYTSAIAELFYTGPFTHGYGGKPWGDIAETLRKLVYGETTFEMFADTAFTLCHNGGPMFNKGMLYHMYEASSLFKILDVQRSGQIPELVREKGSSHVTPDLVAVLNEFSDEYPTETGQFVDWFRVEAAGALHKYPSEKEKQVKVHGHSKIAVEEAKKLAGRFYIMPDVYVTKYDRKVAA